MKHHLLYHVTPMGNWLQNIEWLKRHFDKFDGQIMAVVCEGPGLLPYHEVTDHLPQFKTVIRMANSDLFRETLSLLCLMQVLQQRESDGYAFFGHTKGVTHTDDSDYRKEAIRRWTLASYEENLSDFARVDAALETALMAGCFRQTANDWSNFPPNCPWCFAGTFFWFNVAKMWQRDWRSAVRQHRFGAEAFPGFVCDIEESVCLFGEGNGSLYQVSTLEALMGDKYAPEQP
ncbi:MAG: hypothetical protein E6R03_17085 [Hyphomicrobiaceae bacterium]|nr:MAG: hypothetical protein E6R03_17085 [Hyphomicrobiaceae bacterium]